MLSKVEKPHGVIHVIITRLSPRQLDDDNIRGALKHVRDGIADAFWPNKPQATRDSHDGVVWHYEQEKAKTVGIRVDLMNAYDCECHYRFFKQANPDLLANQIHKKLEEQRQAFQKKPRKKQSST